MNPVETEFLAHTLARIDIIPKVKLDSLKLQGAYFPLDPLRPPRKTTVPLWLARELVRRELCHLVVPEWMQIDNLQRCLDFERQNADSFSQLPEFYLELAQVVLSSTPSSQVDNSSNNNNSNSNGGISVGVMQQIRSLIYDLQTIRSKKIRDGISQVNEHVLLMNNISQMEITAIRPFLTEAFMQLVKLSSD